MAAQSSPWQGPLPVHIIAHQVKVMLFGTGIGRVSNEAFRAEAVRAALWALSASKRAESLIGAAATTRQVLTLARSFWTPFQEADQLKMNPTESKQESEEGSEETLQRDFLDTLAEQGDLLSLAGGHWLPAPLRLVPITAKRYLLVGGLPTRHLPNTVLQTLHLYDSFRQVDGEAISGMSPTSSADTAWQYQSLESWLGPSPPTLDMLIQEFHMRELLPVDHHDAGGGFAEAYEAHLDKPQGLRWSSLDHVAGGCYLLRTSTPWGMRRYSVGEIRNHHLIRESSELRQMDIRRLCYALDRREGVPTRVKWNKTLGTLILKSELPMRERKLLASIGHLQLSEHGYYPRKWVDIQDMRKVDEILEGLGIQVDEDR